GLAQSLFTGAGTYGVQIQPAFAENKTAKILMLGATIAAETIFKPKKSSDSGGGGGGGGGDEGRKNRCRGAAAQEEEGGGFLPHPLLCGCGRSYFSQFESSAHSGRADYSVVDLMARTRCRR